MELTDFLMQRIAEDEASAHQWEQVVRSISGDYPPNRGNVLDPARVLAECEAKRRIVEGHAHTFVPGDDRMIADGYACQECRPVFPEWWCLTIRLLAVPYAAHPDYQEEWRP